MKFRWLVIAGAGLACAGMALSAADSASARAKYKVRSQPKCIDRPYQFSLERLFFGPAPQPNGCAPAVFANGAYVGQDPDSNIRLYLRRDPQSGYSGPQQ